MTPFVFIGYLPVSFKFHLAMNTLAFGCTLAAVRPR